MSHRIRGSEPLISQLRYIVGIALFLSFSVGARADSFAFTYVNSGYGSSPQNTWETSGVLTAATSGQSPSCAYYLCWTVTDMTGQVNGTPIVFSASSNSQIASEIPGFPYDYIATGLYFSTSDGQTWDLVHLEYATPPGGQTALAHPGGTPGAFGDLTFTPIPEPSVFVLLMAGILFVGLMVIRGVRS
jgi:hypothetical protein